VYARPEAENGEPLKFEVSGRLWRDTLIFFDTETESLWSQLLGRAVQGKQEGRALEHLPSIRTTWAEWKSLHPHTKALAKPAELDRSRYQRYFDADDKFGISGRALVDERLPGKHAVLGLEAGETVIAVAVPEGRRDVVRVGLDGLRACVVRDGTRATAWAGPKRGGLRWGKSGRFLEATRGHGRWHPWTGEALSIETESLVAVPSVFTYWFTWSRYHPETELTGR
jgi:hypothetical protein